MKSASAKVPARLPGDEAAERLRRAGLRPTRQRVELAAQLFAGPDRHVTAESLAEEVAGAGIKVSLATVYNTLHQFTAAGLLRQVIVDAARGYFDTNTGDHQHFFLEEDDMLIDIPGEQVTVSGVPVPPPGLTVDRVDVVGSGPAGIIFYFRIILNC